MEKLRKFLKSPGPFRAYWGAVAFVAYFFTLPLDAHAKDGTGDSGGCGFVCQQVSEWDRKSAVPLVRIDTVDEKVANEARVLLQNYIAFMERKTMGAWDGSNRVDYRFPPRSPLRNVFVKNHKLKEFVSNPTIQIKVVDACANPQGVEPCDSWNNQSNLIQLRKISADKNQSDFYILDKVMNLLFKEFSQLAGLKLEEKTALSVAFKRDLKESREILFLQSPQYLESFYRKLEGLLFSDSLVPGCKLRVSGPRYNDQSIALYSDYNSNDKIYFNLALNQMNGIYGIEEKTEQPYYWFRFYRFQNPKNLPLMEIVPRKGSRVKAIEEFFVKLFQDKKNPQILSRIEIYRGTKTAEQPPMFNTEYDFAWSKFTEFGEVKKIYDCASPSAASMPNLLEPIGENKIDYANVAQLDETLLGLARKHLAALIEIYKTLLTEEYQSGKKSGYASIWDSRMRFAYEHGAFDRALEMLDAKSKKLSIQLVEKCAAPNGSEEIKSGHIGDPCVAWTNGDDLINVRRFSNDPSAKSDFFVFYRSVLILAHEMGHIIGLDETFANIFENDIKEIMRVGPIQQESLMRPARLDYGKIKQHLRGLLKENCSIRLSPEPEQSKLLRGSDTGMAIEVPIEGKQNYIIYSQLVSDWAWVDINDKGEEVYSAILYNREDKNRNNISIGRDLYELKIDRAGKSVSMYKTKFSRVMRNFGTAVAPWFEWSAYRKASESQLLQNCD